ncbi:MerR family transcriptional regulator [Klebsiella variicola]|uniref:MerR family transcriptional regulator n=1 Tax=Klebsiella variicola TaxID=244366 RepID=UPI001C27C5DA|nr:MerR family transcriptional regulator [Klebsiella variicola]
MRELDIGEVVKRSGVPASTLRYYEQLGLLHALGRRGLRRQYDERVLERLALIGLGQAAGLSLQQIGASLCRRSMDASHWTARHCWHKRRCCSGRSPGCSGCAVSCNARRHARWRRMPGRAVRSGNCCARSSG